MNRTSEILTKARISREKHQQNIENELKSAITQAVNDTTNSVKKSANSILSDMVPEIDMAKQSLKDEINSKKSRIQTEISTLETTLNKESQKLQQDTQVQIKITQANLQQLSELSQATAQQTQIKKTLSSSIIPLASIVLILLISSIFFGYVSNAKLNEINMQKEQLTKLDTAIQAQTQTYNDMNRKIYQLGGR